MVNATFIENRNISECNDVFCKSVVRSAKKLFEVEVFGIMAQTGIRISIFMIIHCNVVL